MAAGILIALGAGIAFGLVVFGSIHLALTRGIRLSGVPSAVAAFFLAQFLWQLLLYAWPELLGARPAASLLGHSGVMLVGLVGLVAVVLKQRSPESERAEHRGSRPSR